MDKANAYNEYMFDKANAWNSAGAQMERAEAAGINPMLAAAGISGSGATATPMQSAQAGLGMNTSSQNPLELGNQLLNMGQAGVDITDRLGKLIGFGKENKANIKLLNETTNKIKEEVNLNHWQTQQIKRTIKSFVKKWEEDAKAAEENVKNLQALTDKYKSENELINKQKELTEEQTETQKEVTNNERLKKWENEFKKQFRDMFGVMLNDSDVSMLAQLFLNGKGQVIIDALSDTADGIISGLFGKINGNTKEEQKATEKIIDEMWDKLPKEKKVMPYWMFRMTMLQNMAKYGKKGKGLFQPLTDTFNNKIINISNNK